jgi:hypothetical protein
MQETDDDIHREMREHDIGMDRARLEKMSNMDLINYILKQGKRLNTLSTFKTYDVAKRIKDNGWIPTQKQRGALINTAAIALNTI